MKNDSYLWDKSGTPDPTTVRLETALRDLRSAPERPTWLQNYAASVAKAEVTPSVAPSFVATLPNASFKVDSERKPRRWFAGWLTRWPVPQVAFAALAVSFLAGSWWVTRQVQPAQQLAQSEAWTTQSLSVWEMPSVSALVAPVSETAKPVASVTANARLNNNKSEPYLSVAVRRTVTLLPVKARRPTPQLRRTPSRGPAPEVALTPAEAAKAKADLMLALRVINAKLDVAQRNLEGHTIKLPELTDAGR